MAKSVNQVFLMGRLTSDVEMRSTQTGKSVAKFTLAVDNGSKEGGAHFLEVVAWEKLAELLEKYTKKGSKVLIQGSLKQETWEDKDSGKKRSKVVVSANDVTFLDSKSSAEPDSTDTVLEDIDDKPVDLSEIPF